MKIVSKIALVAAVAALAIAGSTADSMARGKKKAAAACAPWSYKTVACTHGVCNLQRCGSNGQWYNSILWCAQPWCPKY